MKERQKERKKERKNKGKKERDKERKKERKKKRKKERKKKKNAGLQYCCRLMLSLSKKHRYFGLSESLHSIFFITTPTQ